MSQAQFTTFNHDAIKIASGRWDRGAWHRAIDIARDMQARGQWDGQSELLIDDPYETHAQMQRDRWNMTEIIPIADPDRAMAAVGEIANTHAQRGAFGDYLSRKAANTIRAHAASLARFADFLNAVYPDLGARLAAFADAVASWADPDEQQRVMPDADAWRGVTHGLVEGFRNWMVQQGDAVASINARLSAVKSFAKLAAKAGALDNTEKALIKDVAGYSRKEAKRVNERRAVTRRGDKKAEHVSISDAQARKLKAQPDTPQGRRDALLMCLLLDHGLRVGEVAILKVSDFELKSGEMRFYRPKVDKVQNHKLTADTLRALNAWFDSGDAPVMQDAAILRASVKGGKLTDDGMTERAITDRVRTLGARVGLFEHREHVTAGGKVKTRRRGLLSAHDCRHYWATHWAGKVDPFRLQEAGGWASLAMPRRYVEESEIANEGMA